jgi:hypothetical protein
MSTVADFLLSRIKKERPCSQKPKRQGNIFCKMLNSCFSLAEKIFCLQDRVSPNVSWFTVLVGS